MFNIFVDSDSIKKTHRTVILNASVRLGCCTFFVADRVLSDVRLFIEIDTHKLRLKYGIKDIKSKIKMIVVESGDNSADDYIVFNSNKNDLCITHDIPLAKRLLDKGCFVIDDRGNEYTNESINSLLMDRNVNNQLREMGVFTDLTKKQNLKTIHSFSSQLDKITYKLKKEWSELHSDFTDISE